MTTTTDWFSKQKRAAEKLQKALKRRDLADFDVRQAELELEAIKAAQRKEGR